MAPIHVLQLYRSQGHNFFGHHGKPPGQSPMIESSQLFCLAGRGIEDDRFLDFKPNYKGQITFFSSEVFNDLCQSLAVFDRSPAVLRRNVITQGIDLNTLIGQTFSIQGVEFLGTGECTPCYWMDQAFAPGTESFLKNRGGLRAKILCSGPLSVDWPPLAQLDKSNTPS